MGQRSTIGQFARWLLIAVGGLATVWATAALAFDFPVAWLRWLLALGYPVTVIALLALTRARKKSLIAWFATLALIMIWWFSLKPTNNRDWQLDVAELPWAEITGDRVTLYGIRNCDYVTETNYTPRWETKTVQVSDIRGVDLFLSYWGTTWIAHAIVSFEFADGSHIATSIEARKTAGQEYSAIRGFFRQFQIIYLVADERDVVRLRTNYRGETVYLYRTLTTAQDAQALFAQYLAWMNQARSHPEWYNAVTSNCATNFVQYLARAKIGDISRWDWRTLFIGKGDVLLYEKRDLAGDLPFAKLKQRALVNEAARAADQAPDFSRRIRQNRPGFTAYSAP